jgi:hypothetical protein
MSAAAEDRIDEHLPPSVLRGIKEELLVRDLINRMEIADGLKELLISSGFTVKSLLNTSASDFAKILGIDEYVAKLLTDAINKAAVLHDSLEF